MGSEPPINTTRTISHDEATESARRLINSHFRQEPYARASIPARPDYDDDLIICAYIKQQAELARLRTGARAGEGVAHPDWHRILDDVAGGSNDQMNDLVTITRESARLGASAIKQISATEYYHNYGAAWRELEDAATLASAPQPPRPIGDA